MSPYGLRLPRQGGRPEERLDDVLRMLSREGAAQVIERRSSPFALAVWGVAGTCFVAIFLMALVVFGYPPIRNLGSNDYSVVFGFWLVLCISMLLANAWQLSQVWLTLRHLLQFLDKLPLRRTLAAFHGFSWGSVWKMGGSVLDMRYKLVFRQMESLTHLRRSLLRWEEKRPKEVRETRYLRHPRYRAAQGLRLDHAHRQDPTGEGEIRGMVFPELGRREGASGAWAELAATVAGGDGSRHDYATAYSHLAGRKQIVDP